MLLLPILSLAAAASPPPADLMRRLAAHDERSQALRKRVVTRMTIVSEELDKEGNPTKRNEAALLLAFQGDREVATVLRATDGGKDVTEEARRKQKDSEGQKAEGNSLSVKMTSPFAAAEQDKYTFEVLDAGDAQVRIRFAPRGEPSPELWTGDALVDSVSGEVISVRSQPSKPPRFVDSMSLELELGATVEGTRMPSKVSFRGEGGFLFIRKRMRGTTEFAYEAPAAAAPVRGLTPAAPPRG